MKTKILLAILVVSGLIYFSVLFFNKDSTMNANSEEDVQDMSADVTVKKSPLQIPDSEVNQPVRITEDQLGDDLELCSESENCIIDFDVMAYYRKLKKSGDDDKIDDLVAFLKEQLDARYTPATDKARAKDYLIKIINEHYPQDDRANHLAQVYELSEDYQKALDTYLILDQKAQKNPKKYERPYLNIAKLYGLLLNYPMAIKYYKLALNDPGYIEIRDYISDSIEKLEEKVQSSKK